MTQYPFRMYGRIIQIYRYSVTYTLDEENITTYAPTLEEAQAIAEQYNATYEELDASEYEWLDNIEVPDVEDTYSEAVKLYETGHFTPTEENRLEALESAFMALLKSQGDTEENV